MAVLQEQVDHVTLFDVPSKSSYHFDTGMRDLTFLKWSITEPQLAIGSANGDLVLFRKDTRKKIPLVGKHTKSVLYGNWSQDGFLALGGSDDVLTILRSNGEHFSSSDIKREPRDFQWSAQKIDEKDHKDFSDTENAATMDKKQTIFKDTTLSMICGNTTLFLYNFQSSEDPLELTFQSKYGTIVGHRWFGDGYIVLAFSLGYVIIISTHIREVGEEVFASRLFANNRVESIALSPTTKKTAIASANAVKFIDVNTWSVVAGEYATTPTAHGAIDGMQFTPDGSILTVSTTHGFVYSFVAQMQTQIVTDQKRVAFLTSVREATVLDVATIAEHCNAAALKDHAPSALNSMPFPLPVPGKVTVNLAVEPSSLAVGPNHIAAVAGNSVYYYLVLPEHLQSEGLANLGIARSSVPPLAMVCEKTFPGVVTSVQLGHNTAAVLVNGEIHLHALPLRQTGSGIFAAPATPVNTDVFQVLPDHDSEYFAGLVTSIAIRGDFLYFGMSTGSMHLFSLMDRSPVPSASLQQLSSPSILQIVPNALGTCAIIVDSSQRCILYNSTDARGILLSTVSDPRANITIENVLWDTKNERLITLCYSDGTIQSFIFVPNSLTGPCVTVLGLLSVDENSNINTESIAMRIVGKNFFCHSNAGIITACSHTPKTFVPDFKPSLLHSLVLPTHNALHAVEVTEEVILQQAYQSMASMRLDFAWQRAYTLQDKKHIWLALAGRAMEMLQVDLAQNIYRALGDAGMVYALDTIIPEKNKKRIAGYMALLFREYDMAKELYLASNRPLLALELVVGLKQLNVALTLAKAQRPILLPHIYHELGKEYETANKIADAIQMYTNALNKITELEQEFSLLEKKERLQGSEWASIPTDFDVDKITQSLSHGTIQSATDSPATKRGGSQALVGSTRASAAPTRSKKSTSPDFSTIAQLVWSGLSRCYVKIGDITKALHAIGKVRNPSAISECAKLLEESGQYIHAASLYQKGGVLEKAVELLLATKQHMTLDAIIEHVTSPFSLAKYAALKESVGDYEAAAAAYQRIGDVEKYVQLYVRQLKRSKEAQEIVRKFRHRPSALLLAKTLQSEGLYEEAIEFFLVAREADTAFDLASASLRLMKAYIRYLKQDLLIQPVSEGLVGSLAPSLALSVHSKGRSTLLGSAASTSTSDNATSGANATTDAMDISLPPSECERIAEWFERNGEVSLAAEYWGKAGHVLRAMSMLLRGGTQNLPMAIHIAATSGSQTLVSTLLDYLKGTSDGVPKDKKWMFRLFVSLNDVESASSVALDIARIEQQAGNYKSARDNLVEMYYYLSGIRSFAVGAATSTTSGLFSDSIALSETLIHVLPFAFYRALNTLHSYLLVRPLIKKDDHDAASRLLLRVVQSIQLFPAHKVPIITSAVVECQRARLRIEAWKQARELMLPENKPLVDEKLIRKIEALVRRQPSMDVPDPQEERSPCPFCSAPVPEYAMQCDGCKNQLPMCIVTGKHMVLDNCSECPNCRFPALYREFQLYAHEEKSCPLCLLPVTIASIRRIQNPIKLLNSFTGKKSEA